MSAGETKKNLLEGEKIVIYWKKPNIVASNVMYTLGSDTIEIPTKEDTIQITSILDRITFNNLIENAVSDYNYAKNGNNHLRGNKHAGINTHLGMLYFCKGQYGGTIKITSPELGGTAQLVRLQTKEGDEIYGLLNGPSEMTTASGNFLVLETSENHLSALNLGEIQAPTDTSNVTFLGKEEAIFSSQGIETNIGTLYFSEQRDHDYVKLIDRDGNEKIGIVIGRLGQEILFEGDETPIPLASIVCQKASIQTYDFAVHGEETAPSSDDNRTIRRLKNNTDRTGNHQSKLGIYIYPKDEKSNIINKKYVVNGYAINLNYIMFRTGNGSILHGLVDDVNFPSTLFLGQANVPDFLEQALNGDIKNLEFIRYNRADITVE